MIKSSQASPRFLYSMRQKAGEEPGNEASSYIVPLQKYNAREIKWSIIDALRYIYRHLSASSAQ